MRVLLHIIDTLLLSSAIVLAVIISQYPFGAGWVSAKVPGLIVFIALGMVALKRGRALRGRVVTWLAAFVTCSSIITAAIAKNAAGFLVL